MESTDQHIKDIFSSRLKEMESPVSEHLWTGIENHLAVTSAAGSSAILKLSVLKWAAAAIVSIAAITGSYWLLTKEEVTVSTTTEQPSPESNQPLVTPESENTLTETPLVSSGNGLNTPLFEDKSVLLSTSETGDLIEEKEEITEEENNGIALLTSSSGQNSGSQQQPFVEAGNNIAEGKAIDKSTGNESVISGAAPLKLTGVFTALPVDSENLRWFFFSADENAVSYEWNMGDGSRYEDISTGHTFASEGIYEVNLKVTNSDGKTIMTEKTLNVYRPAKLNIVNSFSPGMNGKNDQVDFLAGSRNIRQLIRLTITDSRGSKLFESSSSAVWNGETPTGEIAPAAQYFYLLEVIDTGGEKIEKAGTLQLFRD